MTLAELARKEQKERVAAKLEKIVGYPLDASQLATILTKDHYTASLLLKVVAAIVEDDNYHSAAKKIRALAEEVE